MEIAFNTQLQCCSSSVLLEHRCKQVLTTKNQKWALDLIFNKPGWRFDNYSMTIDYSSGSYILPM